MKIFITGANGSLGTALLAKLADSGHEITALALDQRDTYNLEKIKSLRILYGNICELDEAYLKKYLSDIDVLIHLAALVHQPKAAKELYYQVNYDATKKIGAAFDKYSASRIKQFIFISTVSVYGNYQSLPYSEDSVCLPDTPYGESKLLAENYLREAFTGSATKYTILRPATIYGGTNDKGSVGKLIGLLKTWHFFPLFNFGKTLKSFVYVGDVAQAIINCLDNKAAFGQTYNIGAVALDLKEIITRLAGKLGIKVLTIPVPLIFLQMIKPKSKLCQNNCYAFDKAQAAINYSPRVFPDGL